MTITNAKFVIDRTVKAPRDKVFAAFSDLDAKRQWVKTPTDAEVLERTLDFCVGGTERFHARWSDGRITDFQARYHDIVTDERIVLVYDLFHGEKKLSVTLQTIEFIDEGDATRLIHTEQASYFTGGQEAVAGREHGTAWQVDNLVAMLEGRPMKNLT